MSDPTLVHLHSVIGCFVITLLACPSDRLAVVHEAVDDSTPSRVAAVNAADSGASSQRSPPMSSNTLLADSGSGGGNMAAAIGGSGAAPDPAVQVAAPCIDKQLPPVADYGEMGPFVMRIETNLGPGGGYTMFRPDELGVDGFMHPVATWGNGVSTTPDQYTALLSTVASHGFVVIASDSKSVSAQELKAGLDWLLAQNDMPGEFQGKLAVKCAVAIGYSMGGGAAVGAASHPNVIATVALHGLQAPAAELRGPLLLMTSTNDGFVTKSGYVQPTYDASSKVPTIMATLNVPGAADFSGHLIPLGDAGKERAPLIAWLRLFVLGDQAAKSWFYGADCTLCKEPWTDIQRKNGDWN